MNPATDTLLTVAEVARILRVSETWVRAHSNRSRRPHIPSVKMGEHNAPRRFRRSDIEAFIERWSSSEGDAAA